MTESMEKATAGRPAESGMAGSGDGVCPEEHTEREPRRWIWFSVGGVLIALFLVYGAGTFKQSLTPYVSISEATETERRVQVVGELVPGSARFVEESQKLTFGLRDEDGQSLSVLYDGVKPGNLEDAKEIVVIGSYREGVFHAQRVLVKCPSKYQGQGDEHPDSIPMTDAGGGRST